MRTPAALLLLAVMLMWFSPAHADFFDDLGFALNKLGNAVEDGVRDVIGTEEEKQPPQPAAPVPAIRHDEIRWNPPPPGLVTHDMARESEGNSAPLPRVRPTPPLAATSPRMPQNIVDDAPPPRRAPARQPVQVVSSLAPLPGYSQAPALQHHPAYSPAVAAALMPHRESNEPVNIRLPVAKPAVVLEREFALVHQGRSVRLSDKVLRESNARPSDQVKMVLQSVASQLKEGGSLRLRLEAQAIVVDDKLAEARRRSFERGKLIEKWLEEAGVRSTQIDLSIQGAGSTDTVTLSIYKAG